MKSLPAEEFSTGLAQQRRNARRLALYPRLVAALDDMANDCNCSTYDSLLKEADAIEREDVNV